MPAYMGEEEVIKKNMALAQEKTYTSDFMESLPEEVRAELIIVSPSTQSRDYLLKLNKYQDAGVREYWILDAKRNTIHVYDFMSDQKFTFDFKDKVTLGVLDGLEVDFSQFPL
ncbi:MAG: Uma2 family endonuclease [Hungatella sp.]|jgi:hypothetical protein|nr:Uma2 family endonuclease [Hungatella sp.]MCI9638278.1 Uma2 family endonuclease [Hungatella sp.]